MMLEKVLSAIQKYGMFDNEKDVTVALSGGADSCALLYCLFELKSVLNINIYAAHLNHCLRGDEALRDEEFVTELCRRLNVPLFKERIDVKKIASQSKQSTELAARQVRYDFFNRVSKGKTALAHNADDNLETVIFNLARGTAIQGLCGIPPVRDNFVRPLLFCTRREIEEYCSEKNIDYVTDSTNLCDDYTRNKIRHKIMPVLREINGDASFAAQRMCEALRTDNEYLNKTAEVVFKNVFTDGGLLCEKLKTADKALVIRVIKKYCRVIPEYECDNLHLLKIYDMVLSGKGAVTLTKGVQARIDNGLLTVQCGKKTTETVYNTVLFKEKLENVNTLLLKDTADCDKIVGEVKIRTRMPGDKICPAGRGVTKTLKKLFNEMKIEETERKNIPVAADNNGIIWVYGVGVAQRVKTDGKTDAVIVFKTEKQAI